MPLVLLTHGSDYAERVLLALAMRGVSLHAILLARPVPRARSTPPRRSWRAVVTGALRRLGGDAGLPRREDWAGRLSGFAPQVEDCGRLDSPRLAVALRQLAPRWLLLADTGIVPPSLLSIPSRGTLNGHPALLPWVRGVSVVERALERGVPPGASIHAVDGGIDTGPIVRRVLLPVTAHDTLDSLWRKSFARTAELLAEVAADIARGPELVAHPQSQRVPYCRWVTAEERLAAAEAVRRGEAHRLYTEWRDFFGGEVLPLDDSRVPSTLR